MPKTTWRKYEEIADDNAVYWDITFDDSKDSIRFPVQDFIELLTEAGYLPVIEKATNDFDNF